MHIPDDLRYSTDHEWVRVEGGAVRIGITDYAQDALGDVVFIDLPEVGAVVEALPRTHLAHETVVTPWEQKGTVMRTLVEMSKDREVQLIDGVKVRHDDGWALALPDPEEPITHIWSEGDTDAEARALATEYARRIRQLLR